MVYWCELDPERPVGHIRKRGVAPTPADGPLCLPLLGDFAGVMLAPDRIPRHLCKTIATESLERWRRTNGIEALFHLHRPTWDGREALRGWRDSWPLIVGRAALAHDADRRSSGWSEPSLAVFSPALPFDGQERALFAVTAQLDGLTLEVFGLANLFEQDAQGGDVCRMGGLAWRLRGLDYSRDMPKVLRILKNARRWWNQPLSGITMPSSPKAGRPKGSRKGAEWSRDRILRWWCKASERFAEEDTQPTLRDLASAMGLASEKTARGRVDQVGLHWPPTAEELEAFSRDHPDAIELT